MAHAPHHLARIVFTVVHRTLRVPPSNGICLAACDDISRLLSAASRGGVVVGIFRRSKENRERVRTAEFLPKLVNLLKMSRHLLKNSLVKQKTIQLTINVATSNPTNKLLLQRVRGASLPSARPPFCAPNHPQRSPANAHRAVSVPPP